MKSQLARKRSAMGLLIFGMMFLTLGLATDQTPFTWISIACVLTSMVMGGKWFGKK